MKINELRQKSIKDLQEALQNHRKQLEQLRFDLASGKVKNIKGVRKIKKEIARILTAIKKNEKQ